MQEADRLRLIGHSIFAATMLGATILSPAILSLLVMNTASIVLFAIGVMAAVLSFVLGFIRADRTELSRFADWVLFNEWPMENPEYMTDRELEQAITRTRVRYMRTKGRIHAHSTLQDRLDTLMTEYERRNLTSQTTPANDTMTSTKDARPADRTTWNDRDWRDAYVEGDVSYHTFKDGVEEAIKEQREHC